MAMRTLWTVAPVARVLGRGGAASASASARGDEASSHLATRNGTSDPSSDPFSVEISAGAPRVGRGDAWRELGFSSAREMREQHGSDLHRHNRRRLRDGRAPVTEAEFEAMLRTNEGSDLSSISGSDDSDSSDDDSLKKEKETTSASSRGSSRNSQSRTENAQMVVEAEDGSRFGVWRCLAAPSSSSRDLDPVAARAALRDARGGVDRDRPWVVILARGGHFAATAFDPTCFVTKKETKTLTDLVPSSAATSARKTFHRYVVRAKAGGRQSGADGGGKTIKSAGSSVRRANEAALEREIRELFLVDPVWRSTILNASLIFVSASKTDERTLFSGADAPLSRDDARVRRVPFATKRPTFNETRRVVGKLALVTHDLRVEEVTVADKDAEGGGTVVETHRSRSRLTEVVSDEGEDETRLETRETRPGVASRRLTPAQAERLAAAKARAAEAAAALGELGMGDDIGGGDFTTGNTATAAEGSGSAPSLSKKEKEKLKKRRAKERARAERERAASSATATRETSGSATLAADDGSRSPSEPARFSVGGGTGGKAAALLAKARQSQNAKRDEAVRDLDGAVSGVILLGFFLRRRPRAFVPVALRPRRARRSRLTVARVYRTGARRRETSGVSRRGAETHRRGRGVDAFRGFRIRRRFHRGGVRVKRSRPFSRRYKPRGRSWTPRGASRSSSPPPPSRRALGAARAGRSARKRNARFTGRRREVEEGKKNTRGGCVTVSLHPD